MDTSEKREPLLKELRFQRAPGRAWVNMGAGDVRDFYEAKIASGELRVVVKKGEWEMVRDRTGGMADTPAMFAHKDCPAVDRLYRTQVAESGYNYKPSAKFCADCGAQIIDP